MIFFIGLLFAVLLRSPLEAFRVRNKTKEFLKVYSEYGNGALSRQLALVQPHSIASTELSSYVVGDKMVKFTLSGIHGEKPACVEWDVRNYSLSLLKSQNLTFEVGPDFKVTERIYTDAEIELEAASEYYDDARLMLDAQKATYAKALSEKNAEQIARCKVRLPIEEDIFKQATQRLERARQMQAAEKAQRESKRTIASELEQARLALEEATAAETTACAELEEALIENIEIDQAHAAFVLAHAKRLEASDAYQALEKKAR